MKKAIAFLLCLCLFAAALPVCAEQSSFPEYTYDNSFLLTVESSENKVYTLEDFPDISADYVFTASKRLESKTGPFTYVLMFVFGTDAENKIESALNKYGEKAKRNYYAKDYAKKSSYITLSDSEIYLAVGQNGEITVTDALLALQNTVGKIELSKVQTLSGDMNGDGKISVDDALVILQMTVGK